MTALAKALEAADWSQVELAEALGVAPNTVWRWTTGAQPLPASRVGQIVEHLGCRAEELDGMVSAKARRFKVRRQPPATFLAWYVENVMVVGGERPYRAVVEEMARQVGVSLFTMRDWLEGRKAYTVEAVRVWREFWPTFPVAACVYEVAVEDPDAERRAIRLTLSTAPEFASFEEADNYLTAAWEAFKTVGPTLNFRKAGRALREVTAEPVAEPLMEKAEEFAKLRGLL